MIDLTEACSDCPCGVFVKEVATAYTLVIPKGTEKVFLILGGGASITLPKISTIFRGIEITLFINGSGSVTITPHSTDRIGTGATGASITGSGSGRSGWLRIGSPTSWSVVSSSFITVGLLQAHGFSTVPGQKIYTPAQLGLNLTGFTLTSLFVAGQDDFLNGNVSIITSGINAGGIEFTYEPATANAMIYYK